MKQARLFAGIDLAWQESRDTGAVSFGGLDGVELIVDDVYPAVLGNAGVAEAILPHRPVLGVAVDAPLIMADTSGQRPCEDQLSQDYRSRAASCHTSNLTLYPRASSVTLSRQLSGLGFAHLAANGAPYQIECSPHPAIIEIFGLDKRLPYKKGAISERKKGQAVLSRLIRWLERSHVFRCRLNGRALQLTEEDRIHALAGKRLKENEDALHSLICVYTAALYYIGVRQKTYGDRESGYIDVPRQKCVRATRA